MVDMGAVGQEWAVTANYSVEKYSDNVETGHRQRGEGDN
jgi:hypothetical protein